MDGVVCLLVTIIQVHIHDCKQHNTRHTSYSTPGVNTCTPLLARLMLGTLMYTSNQVHLCQRHATACLECGHLQRGSRGGMCFVVASTTH
jgi:hypothetical protein